MEVVRILALAAISFIVSLILTPFLSNFLYRHKERLGKQIRDGQIAPVYHRLHRDKKGTPTNKSGAEYLHISANI